MVSFEHYSRPARLSQLARYISHGRKNFAMRSYLVHAWRHSSLLIHSELATYKKTYDMLNSVL